MVFGLSQQVNMMMPSPRGLSSLRSILYLRGLLARTPAGQCPAPMLPRLHVVPAIQHGGKSG